MTEISEKEVEAALSAWNNYNNSGPVAEDRSDAMRVALEAAARVRAENDAFQDAVVTGLGAVKMDADGSAERVDLRAEPSGWRPIETAPKDGTWIIAHRPNKGVGYLDRVVVVRWENEVSAWVWPDKPFDIYDEDLSERVYADSWADQISLFEDNSFTHWMPLPAPPTAGGGDVG